MTSVMASRILCVLKVLHRPQQCLSGYIHHSLSFCTSPKTLVKEKKTCLDEVTSVVSRHVRRDNSSQNKLLVVHNPADETLIEKLKRKGVKRMCCIVESDDHLQFLRERLKSTHENNEFSDYIYKHSLMSGDILSKSTAEKDILDSVNEVKGVIFLSSFVVPLARQGLCRSVLNQRLETLCSEGFYAVGSVDWFCLLSEHDIKSLTRNIAPVRFFRTFHDFNICYTMKFQEAMSLFKCIDTKTALAKGSMKSSNNKHGRETRRNQIESSDVNLVHIVPKFDVIEQTTLEERQMFKVYLNHQHVHERLIPFTEKWVPGSGRHLIHQGYSMADEIGTLSAEKHFQVFKMIKSLPEYGDSGLHTLLEEKPLDSMGQRPR